MEESTKNLLVKLNRLYEIAMNVQLFNQMFFETKRGMLPIHELSSGEISLLVRLSNLLINVKDNMLVLIDEPEIHLHPKWILEYISSIDRLFKNIKCHFIIATHSPLLLSNVSESDVVLLRKDEFENIVQESVVNPFAMDPTNLLNDIFNVSYNETSIIADFSKKIDKLLKSEDPDDISEGRNLFRNLQHSELKVETFIKYFDVLKGDQKS